MPGIRLALVGSAREASPWLLRSLAKIGTFEAVCDPSAEREAAYHGARWTFSELATMLREAEPQGVVLLRPLDERPRLAKECLAARAAVLVPGSPGTAAACKRIETLARLANRTVFAAPPIRFSPAVLLAQKMVDSGRLGAPTSMMIRSARPAGSTAADKNRRAVSMDQVYEAVDLVFQFIGLICRVHAVEHPDGTLAALAETATAVPVSMMLHAARPAEESWLELEIHSADGAVLRIGRNLELFCGTRSRVEAARDAPLPNCDPALELGYEGLLARFAKSVEVCSTTPPGVTPCAEGGWGMAGPVPQVTVASEGVLAAAARRRPVALKLAEPPAEVAPPHCPGQTRSPL